MRMCLCILCLCIYYLGMQAPVDDTGAAAGAAFVFNARMFLCMYLLELFWR